MTEFIKAQSLIFPVNKIKHFIQKNQNIGKISSIVSIMISKVLELLVIEILNEAMLIMEKKKNTKIRKKHIRLIIKKKIHFFRI
jgi:histone H3/H4